MSPINVFAIMVMCLVVGALAWEFLRGGDDDGLD